MFLTSSCLLRGGSQRWGGTDFRTTRQSGQVLPTTIASLAKPIGDSFPEEKSRTRRNTTYQWLNRLVNYTVHILVTTLITRSKSKTYILKLIYELMQWLTSNLCNYSAVFLQTVTARNHKSRYKAMEIRMSQQELGLSFGLCRLCTVAFMDY